jgi:hypothetical protein
VLGYRQIAPECGCCSGNAGGLSLAMAVGCSGSVRRPTVVAMLAEEPFGSPMFDFLSAFSGTIAGGTNEIKRNIVAERGHGMTRV